MAAKKIEIKKKPTVAQADEWVEKRRAENQKKAKVKRAPGKAKTKEAPEELRRFTIDISEQLHRKIKAKAAMEGVTMAKMLRHILEKEFK